MGFVDNSDTDGAGGRDGNGLDAEVSWAFAKREDKRMVMVASWKMDADILKNCFVAVVDVVEGRDRKGREREKLKKRGRRAVTSRLMMAASICRRGTVPIINLALPAANIFIPIK